jgi:uncharacterized protein
MRLYLVALLALPAVAPAAAQPQSLLPTEKVIVDTRAGPRAFTVEIAADAKSRERGLMFRTRMADTAGMLFDFQESQLVDFWMENTILPLDMLFVRKDGTIANIQANAVPYSRDTIPSEGAIQVVIEINAGLAKKLGIRPGEIVHAPQLHNMARAK